MYKILNLQTGDIVYTSSVIYVKKNPASGAWIRTEESDAEAVSIAGQLFNLPGRQPIDKLCTAIIKSLDVAAKLHAVEQLTDQNETDVNLIVDAVCEIGEENALLMDAVMELSDKLEEVIDNG